MSQKVLFLFIVIISFFLSGIAGNTGIDNTSSQVSPITITFNDIILSNIETDINIIFSNDSLKSVFISSPNVLVNGNIVEATIINENITVPFVFEEETVVTISVLKSHISKTINPIPLWLSILPPLFAIIIALVFREVFSALFIGILFGSTIISWYQGNMLFIAIFKGLFTVIDTYILKSLNNSGHLSIIVFSMLIGAMVNLISRNGGMQGVVNYLSRYARSPQSGQFITWLLGIAIFFDDYANTLVVGNTMRPITDKLKISREKLSYIVDSTAAPIAAIAFVTTWIGAELSYIQDGIEKLNLNESAYQVFINSLSFAFYPVLALLFILILIWQKKDFGPMYKAELLARKGNINVYTEQNDKSNCDNNLDVAENAQPRAINAILPVLVIVVGTIAGLIYTGLQSVSWNDELGFYKNLSTIIGSADTYKALLWSSISGVLIAIALTLSQRILSLRESIDSLVDGFKTMLSAILILSLAWALALVTEDLHTAHLITNILLTLKISPYLIPSVTIVMAAFISFSTGSSWGTMAILYPLILPASWLISVDYGLPYETSMLLFYNVVSAVLAGSVLGDHCSPISDTTILSSLASSCNHISHVNTQLPYAITVGAVSVLFGTLPAAYGVSSWILFPLNLIILFLIVRFYGKKTD